MQKPGSLVMVTLRQMIGSGELAAGERLVETAIAERLGVSRMPVRTAFRELASEGLLVRAGVRGYMVRHFTYNDIVDGVEVRGVLEGLAARQLGERGLDESTQKRLRSCLAEGDRLLAKGYLDEKDAEAYHSMNVRFHEAIVSASGNTAVTAALARNDHLPFASVKAMTINTSEMEREFRRLNYAHMQHHAIVDALEAGQAARVEALMREHAAAVIRYTDLLQSADPPLKN
ncbi:GntR family transcriptional regulator [Gimibacter soli]|uniref:GntR family transcriptional regulator n=1 Tax=Gimibacter soli TaxID=3024400 RepID=A0AAE9XNS8_9PROT|nr:GntR family transcriptional regulator [Gimibacter soli]WCL53437.1 GntR family transcriptional regulator [Gimibacter soli]